MSFDREEAVRQAMLLFWRHGYESTSLTDLTSAMNVKPPSIYIAFGDKKGLFREAVQMYQSGPVTSQSIIRAAQTARDAAWGLLSSAAVGFTGEQTPAGCLLASATISCSTDSADIQAELSAIRKGIEQRLQDRITEDIEQGVLPNDVDPEVWASYVMSVIQGMSTLARDGAQREKLLGIAKIAIGHWPGPNTEVARQPITNSAKR